MSDSDDDNPKQKSKKGSRKQDTFIREDSENPVDLLDQQAFSHVSTHKPITQHEEFQKRAKAASRASSFKSRDGRLVFEEPAPVSKKQHADAPEYNAYQEMQDSNDMAKRGLRDKVKFSNKRSRQDAEGFDDVEMTEAYGGDKKTPPKKRQVSFGGRKKGFQKRRPVQ